MVSRKKWQWDKSAYRHRLELIDDGQSSVVVLPFRHTSDEYILIAFSYLAILGIALCSLYTLFSGRVVDSIALFFGLSLLPLGILSTTGKVAKIELRRKICVFYIRYGFIINRKVRLKPRSRYKFNGQYQSYWTKLRHQQKPLFVLEIKNVLAKRFYIACDEKQGSWIVENLDRWNKHCIEPLLTDSSIQSS
ncbi:MAG: hypothetical protein GY854_32665 [Deltaproteobacteria bacterium]|nr:hypothetical protein [Deltaproteobacteria bacterium]